MPAVDNWLEDPLLFVNIYTDQRKNSEDENAVSWITNVHNYFQSRIIENNCFALNRMVSLNSHCVVSREVASQSVSCNDSPFYPKSGQLVKFRCMIQDIRDPEIYMKTYGIRVEQSDQSTTQQRCGLFRDNILLHTEKNAPAETVLVESPLTTYGDRHVYFCTKVPGESEWVQEVYELQGKSFVNPHQGSQSGLPETNKRPHEETTVGDCGIGAIHISDGSPSAKRKNNHWEQQRMDKQVFASPTTDLSVFVKWYQEESFNVNEVVEFVGILDFDPVLADDVDSDEMRKQDSSRLCIHAVWGRKILSGNPLLHLSVDNWRENFPPQWIQSTRAKLNDALTSLLSGDTLAAEYLLCNLVSNVYMRKDVLTLGKFTLNLIGKELCQNNFSKMLLNLLEVILTKVVYVPLSIGDLNAKSFTPTKDYTLNKLVSGTKLQLSEHTCVLIDETTMTAGQLNPTGVRNVTALGNLITWQKVEYDFTYNRIDYPANVNIVVLSEGKSILPSDCSFRFTPDPSVPPRNCLPLMINQPDLNEIRQYIDVIRQLDYEIPEAIQQWVQEDFVNMRKLNSGLPWDDFHFLLVFARWLSLSNGETALTKETWIKAKNMEVHRKSRSRAS